MSSISGILSSAVSSGDSSGGGSVASQVAALSKQIQNITTQLKELSSNADLTDKQKAEMQQMYESQITMLEAQIAQLEQKQAEQAEQKNDDSKLPGEIKADGVNRPTDTNQLDVYI
ncbi:MULTISPECIES: FlxA-like family protein [Pantoea]|uniref:FlxA n=1 Tax=Pantoea brenneri TaxID=472694 RepID=A0A653RK90_9GAMM|nr:MULTISPECIES: FlxA-like family protein [Pantoea]KKD32571.1 FlxA [Pantoea sp. 3.5.1]MBS6033375.1 FlxA-like family protein [Pantoea sp.]MBZ6394825.1 FlxA-like family protein [Pantoea sp.]MBZ6438580.1 FlxA-like family protein [Pantoea sp.]MCQ5470647.1 FlxA-like family protein [Pantoea brenneri]